MKHTGTPEVRLIKIDEAIRRHQRRITRNVNAMAKLERQRKRLAKLLAKPAPAKPEPTRAPVIVKYEDQIVAEIERPAEWVFPIDRSAELSALRKKQEDSAQAKARGEEADRKAVEEIKAAQAARAKIKAKASAAKSKAKARGELRKMPLQGKAALEAIRGK